MFFVVIYLLLFPDRPQNTLIKLLKECIPSIIVVLLSIQIGYLLFYYKYKNDLITRGDIDDLKELIISDKSDNLISKLPEILRPVKCNNGYRYTNRSPNGLKKEVYTGPVFQNFSTGLIIQGLWADPQSSSSLIRAYKHLKGTTKQSLLVEFSRHGCGCDVTMKQKDGQLMYTGNGKLIIRIQAEKESFNYLQELDAFISFRLRIVDELDNHWGWGHSINEFKNESICYEKCDHNQKEMRLVNTDEMTFVFDLSCKEKWAFFHHDGGLIGPHNVMLC